MAVSSQNYPIHQIDEAKIALFVFLEDIFETFSLLVPYGL